MVRTVIAPHMRYTKCCFIHTNMYGIYRIVACPRHSLSLYRKSYMFTTTHTLPNPPCRMLITIYVFSATEIRSSLLQSLTISNHISIIPEDRMIFPQLPLTFRSVRNINQTHIHKHTCTHEIMLPARALCPQSLYNKHVSCS